MFCHPASSRCLDAFTVALNEAYGGEGWYTSTLHLQLASWSFCEACRAAPTLHVAVDWETPRRMWARRKGSTGAPRQARVLPPVRPFRLTWRREASELCGVSQAFGENLEQLVFGGDFEDSVECVVWPGKRLKTVTFGEEITNPYTLKTEKRGFFDSSIETVVWPASLETLAFHGAFNQSLNSVKWPPRLKELTLSRNFDRSIAGVRWPKSLEKLALNWNFDQPIEGITLPGSLQELHLSHLFNQPIARVRWPASLRRLYFQGGTFNQPIDKVSWPPSLISISFGHHFNQALAEVNWPPSLRYLAFGVNFNQPLQAVAWPPRIKKVGLPSTLKNQHLDGVVWPESLQELVFSEPDATGGGHKVQRIPWPASRERVAVPPRPQPSKWRFVKRLALLGEPLVLFGLRMLCWRSRELAMAGIGAVIVYRFWQLEVMDDFDVCCDNSAYAVVCYGGCSLKGLVVLSFWSFVGVLELAVACVVLLVCALFLTLVNNQQIPEIRVIYE